MCGTQTAISSSSASRIRLPCRFPISPIANNTQQSAPPAGQVLGLCTSATSSLIPAIACVSENVILCARFRLADAPTIAERQPVHLPSYVSANTPVGGAERAAGWLTRTTSSPSESSALVAWVHTARLHLSMFLVTRTNERDRHKLAEGQSDSRRRGKDTGAER